MSNKEENKRELLTRIFKAQSIAIIGASRDETKRGYQAINSLLQEKYEGRIYPINPREESILGLKCYKNIQEIGDVIDLVLITTPTYTIPDLIEECGRKGVAGAVIIAGGFGETGDKGKRLEEKLVKIAGKYNMRIIGPNTSGMINVHENINLVGLQGVPKGNIALLTQSGNIALNLITEVNLKSQQGFTYYVGIGNEADMKFHEYLEYFTNDSNTKAILIYVEGLREGRRFLQQAYKTTGKKPIILLKSGRTSTGQKSAGSHTGALAGISEVALKAFERAGITTIENSDELFPAAETLTLLPPIKNKKIAILADGGGHATIASDTLTDLGIEIPRLQKSTINRLKEVLPATASFQNPIDVAGGTDANPSIFADCAEILLEDKNIGGLLIVGLFGGYGIRFSKKLTFKEEDAAHRMGKLINKFGKPIILHSLYYFAKPHSHELLRYYSIPVYDSLEIACKSMSVLCKYGSYINAYHHKTNFIFNWGAKAKKECKTIIEKARNESRRALLEHEAREILRMHKAPVTTDMLAGSPDEAAKFAKKIGGPVAMKIVSKDILHKSDAKGVMLNLKTGAEVREAFNTITKNAREYNSNVEIEGCLVSPMVEKGVEIIIGTKIDDQFGPVIMFGLGGILVEVVKDVAFRVLPISRRSARTMLNEIKSSPILNGVRREPPVNKDAIVDLLCKISEIIESYPEIQEMDLNPVIAYNNKISIVDARIILKKRNRRKNEKPDDYN